MTATPAPTQKEKLTTKPSKKPHRLARWIRTHHRLLTFIGAVIVFGTFIVKDALRENLKDLVDTTNRAEGTYLVRRDVNQLRRELQIVRLQANKSTMHTGIIITNMGIPIAADPITTVDVRSLKDANIQLVENVELLLAKLPSWIQQQDGTTLAVLKSRNQKIASLSEDLPSDVKPHEFNEEANKVFRDELAIEEDAGDFAQKVLQQARGVESTNEHRYEIATWASYFLYAFGWGLGLIGRLVGVETGADE